VKNQPLESLGGALACPASIDDSSHGNLKGGGDLAPAHSGLAHGQSRVSPEDALWSPELLPVCLGRPNARSQALTNHLALEFGKRREDVKQEPRHWVAFVRVDVLRDGKKRTSSAISS
jgi:hypothetical protein